MTRRSTRTVTVLSLLSLTTVPHMTRLGMLLAPRSALLRRGLLGQDGLDPRDVAAHHAHPRGVLELAAGALEAQVELLLLELGQLIRELVGGLQADVTGFHGSAPLADALHEARGDRQLGRGERERLGGQAARHAVDLEHDAPRLDPADPEFRRALARAHAHLGGLGRDRHVREHAHPDAAEALDVTRHGAARGLDLARREPARLDRLEAVGAEIQGVAALGLAMDAALVRLAVLGAGWLQHVSSSSFGRA